MVRNPRKSSSGAVLEHFGDPLGAKMVQDRHQEPKMNEKSSILGWLVGSKMKQKSLKNLMKNHIDFYIDFETTFS